MDTLVLDTQGFPVAFVTWQRAVNLYFQDRATVVTDDAKRILLSPSFEMGLPRVIRLRNHMRRKLRLKVPIDTPQHRYPGQQLVPVLRARAGNSGIHD